MYNYVILYHILIFQENNEVLDVLNKSIEEGEDLPPPPMEENVNENNVEEEGNEPLPPPPPPGVDTIPKAPPPPPPPASFKPKYPSSLETSVNSLGNSSSYDDNMADILAMQDVLSQFETTADELMPRPPTLPLPPTIPPPPIPPLTQRPTSGLRPIPPVLPPPPTIPAPPLPGSDGIQNLILDNVNEIPKTPTAIETLSPTIEKNIHNMMSFDLESPENKMNGHVVPVRDLGEDEHVFYDILEYAEKYYNDHPRDVGGTIMKSLRKRPGSGEVRTL